MPFRETLDPYKILVSEIMLQQTQVSRGMEKYKEFLKIFPTLQSLAATDDKTLMRTWKGLGYWRRAKFLKETAKEIVKNKNGVFPKTPNELEKLPGIGPYTARALACFAFGSKEAFIDTNIRRVYIHFFFPDKKNISDGEILKIAEKAVLQKNPREWHYALFDYGAMELKDKTINKRAKKYARQSKFEGSFRFFRTKVVRLLLEEKEEKIPVSKIHNTLKKELSKHKSAYKKEEVINSLLKDKLIKKRGAFYSI